MIKIDNQVRDELIKRFSAIINTALEDNADIIMRAIKENHAIEVKLGRAYSRLDLLADIRIRTDGTSFSYNGNIEYGFNIKHKIKAGEGYYNPLEMDLFTDVIESKPLKICESTLPKDYKKKGKK